MTDSLQVSVFPYPDRSYAPAVDAARQQLGAPNNPTLFPGHFLKASFPKIGGRLALLRLSGDAVGVGFLFPRALRDGRREYTVRLHRARPDFTSPAGEIADLVGRAIGAAAVGLEPGAEHVYAPPMAPDEYIGRPGAADAGEVRALQNRIWAPPSPDGLYPADIHSLDFAPGTSLIAKIDGNPAGFLFGFYKFGGAALPPAITTRHAADFRLESQLMGVLGEYRRRSLAVDLKRRQAELAEAEGMAVVNWTFDPLQYANARLNFGRLGGIAFDFMPNYYDFVNQLNLAPASRLSVTWLIRSERVRRALAGSGESEVDLGATDVVRLNHGPDRAATPTGARRVAIEVPADWTALQGAATSAAEAGDSRPLEAVLNWRKATDEIFGEYLGVVEGKYVLTGTGRNGDRRYLLGERIDDALLGRLGE